MNLKDGDLLRCMWGPQSPERGSEMRRLLAEGANPNGHTPNGLSFLAIAAKKADVDAVEALLAAGASIEPDPLSHNSIVALAATGSDSARPDMAREDRRDVERIQIVAMLVGAGANIEEPSATGITALAKTIEYSDEVALALIEMGANIFAKNDMGQTMVSLAMLRGSPEMAKILIDRGVDVNEPSKYFETPLMEMVDMGSVAAMKELISWGANVDAPAKSRGMTPLHLAVHKGMPSKVAILLDAGANPNLHGVDGETPLILAAKNCSPTMISQLLAAGADAMATCDSGRQAKDFCSPGSAAWSLLEEVVLGIAASKPEMSRSAPRI